MTTSRGAGPIGKVWCDEAAEIDPAAWAKLGKPRGTGPVYTVCHDDLVDLPETNLAKHIIQLRPGFTTTPPDCPVIGMKALTNSGEEVTLVAKDDALFFNLFWETESELFTTDPCGRRYLGKRSSLDIERWEILNPEAE